MHFDYEIQDPKVLQLKLRQQQTPVAEQERDLRCLVSETSGEFDPEPSFELLALGLCPRLLRLIKGTNLTPANASQVPTAQTAGL